METSNANGFTIEFHQFSANRVTSTLKEFFTVYLGFETVYKLWELPIIKYRIGMLKKQFVNFFKILKKVLKNQEGDVFSYALNILCSDENLKSENICMVLELLYPLYISYI